MSEDCDIRSEPLTMEEIMLRGNAREAVEIRDNLVWLPDNVPWTPDHDPQFGYEDSKELRMLAIIP